VVRGTTLYLKLAVIVIGIPILAVCIFLVPLIAKYAAILLPDMTYIKSFIYIDLYASAIPFYFALYQAYKLLSYIDHNNAFSDLSVKALKYIKYCAMSISALYTIGLPIFYLIADKDDAPGVIIIALIIIFASSVIAVFAAVLQRLLYKAIEIKSENDFTV